MNSSKSSYDRQVALRVINKSHELSKIYLERCKTESMDLAIRWVYENHICDSPWEPTYETTTVDIPFYDNVQLDVAPLIEKYGWGVFKAGIVRYAARRAATQRAAGRDSKRWETIRDRMDSIPKYAD